MTEKTLFAGFGGQGIVSLGMIWVYCGMKEGKNVTFFPFYGAEKRGGIARAGVVVSDEEIASPLVTYPDSALVMNSDSLPVCEKSLKAGGLLVLNTTLVKEKPSRSDIKVVGIDITKISEDVGKHPRFANMVALGVMAKLTGALHLQGVEDILKHYFPESKHKYIPANVACIRAGLEAVH
jgi:2-oxoglutarate ferredoxin oxidoreductase subunit gamma